MTYVLFCVFSYALLSLAHLYELKSRILFVKSIKFIICIEIRTVYAISHLLYLCLSMKERGKIDYVVKIYLKYFGFQNRCKYIIISKVYKDLFFSRDYLKWYIKEWTEKYGINSKFELMQERGWICYHSEVVLQKIYTEIRMRILYIRILYNS